MAAVRTLLSKYWILIVIVLWVIAWANRDHLMGGTEVGTAAVAESVDPIAQAAPAPEPASGPEPSPGSAEASGSAEVASEGVPGAAAPAQPDADAQRAAPETSAAEPPRPAQPDVARTEGRDETQATSGAELLARARVVLENRGPRGAAEVLARGLRDIPEDAPERADLLGELGNFYISVGDFQRALAAYDRALVALPEDARGTMITRLAPVYDRFHPMGRSHLEQFR